MKNNADLLSSLEDFLKEAEVALTFEQIFDLTGTTEALKKIYLSPKDLRREYVNILYKGIKNFVAAPLYSNLSLNREDDLTFLNKSEDFKDSLKSLFGQIKKSLSSKKLKLLDYLNQFDHKSQIKLEKLITDLKTDKSSLLFMLDDLKDSDDIYDYNGRQVTLK